MSSIDERSGNIVTATAEMPASPPLVPLPRPRSPGTPPQLPRSRGPTPPPTFPSLPGPTNPPLLRSRYGDLDRRSRSRSRSPERERERERARQSRSRERRSRERREAEKLEEKNAWRAFREASPWIVDAAELDWEHWHNRYGEGQGRHIVEVLNVSPSIEEEVKSEMARERPQVPDKYLGDATEPGEHKPWPLTGIQRIRILSPWIIAQLCNASEEGRLDPDIPHTFLRPFQTLAYLQPGMKKALDIIKAKSRGDDVDLPDEDDANAMDDEKVEHAERNSNSGGDSENEGSTFGLMGKRYPGMDAGPLLEHLEFYIKFVDEKVMPLFDTYAGTSHKKIRFNDLGLLFRPGQIVYRPPMGSISSVPYAFYQPVWRVYHAKRTTYDDVPDDIFLSTGDEFHICALYLNYDGELYGTIKTKFDIPCFKGEKDIVDLPVYPLRYAEGVERLRKDLTLQGQMFKSFLKEHHLFYDGWSIPSELLEREGEDKDEEDNRPRLKGHVPTKAGSFRRRSAPEHVEGPVVVDFEEAFHHHPRWKPEFRGSSTAILWTWTLSTGLRAIWHWLDDSRSQLSFKIRELIIVKDDVVEQEKSNFLHSPDMLRFRRSGDQIGVDEEMGENIILLPRHIVGYSLRDRRFYNLDVHSLRRLEKHADIFQDLKINPGHQRIIQSLVTAHFESRRMQKEKPFLSLSQDLVYGKGSGLFILLHGVPGVGKTATAEAVAQHFNKPLFSITCGNLGLEPTGVEAELKEIFRLAHLWDCVLLLDEADVFLARRDIASLKRNALVSVFLRVLEYYSGILFLTTNRVGTIDEAFKSRIHLSLYYERLSQKQMEAIFKVHIRRLRAIEQQKTEQLHDTKLEEMPLDIRDQDILDFAKEHWESTLANPSRRWNGRQIRNAFQIASSLARFDRGSKAAEGKRPATEATSSGEPIQNPAPVLDGAKFKLVSDAIKRFNQYFELATGESDEQAALLDGIRYDSARNRDLGPSTRSDEKKGSRSEKGQSSKRGKERRSDYSDGLRHGNDSNDDHEDHHRGSGGKSRRDKDRDPYHSHSDWPRERDRDRDAGSRSGGKHSSSKGKWSGGRTLSPPRTPSGGGRKLTPAPTSSSKRRSKSPRGSSPRYGKGKSRRDGRHDDSGSEGEESASYSGGRRRGARDRREKSSEGDRYSEGDEY
ncbi:hypothetical protein B0T16DRAFT_339553 [Cercophora newfieldiana]|uniref:AAA+ ATPase domain-containing protein n=1 Tax=Cercophora newfieldiana TaxID=92897 RepID=A0AA39YLR3_9PEZI|nr:hypothetical protein B0T16DRAFT_339553 [Cercophora newfieldiana]